MGAQCEDARHRFAAAVFSLAFKTLRNANNEFDPRFEIDQWQAIPIEETIHSTAIRDLPHITYGRVPAGFTQKIPAQGAPAPLVEGKIYEAGGPSSGANMNVFRFTIQNGSAVENLVDLALKARPAWINPYSIG